ncbi:MAG TPA: GAF domain-containing protein [Pilimelia sp.]|nr:GAF domain-containing protein [Pilimelia sp.]
MRQPTPPGDAVLAEVVAIGAMPGGIAERARALLQPLRRLLAFDAACVTLLDPERWHHHGVLRHGYPPELHAHLDSAEFVDNLQRLGMHRHRSPLRVKDLPGPPQEVPGWAQYLAAGFREGVGLPLHTPDGRYLGLLAAHTQDPVAPSDATCDRLAAMAPLLAHAVDPMRSVAALASLVGDAVAGVVLTGAGGVAALPGLPDHRLLVARSPATQEALRCLASGAVRTAFLCPDRGAPDGGRYRKVTVLACPFLPPGHLRGVVMLSPAGGVHGLTHRELSLLGALLAGWDRRRVAAAARLPGHAVVAALDTVRAKLGALSRDAAVLRAAALGLYLPPSLRRACC